LVWLPVCVVQRAEELEAEVAVLKAEIRALTERRA
jgi:hypothetical protein